VGPGQTLAEWSEREKREVAGLPQQQLSKTEKRVLASEHFDKARKHYQAHEYQEALEAIKKVLAIFPESANAYNLMGLTLRKLRRQQEAKEAFQHALRLNAKNYIFYWNLGHLYYEGKLYGQAAEQFRVAATLKPNDAMIRYYLCTSYLHLKDRQSALEEYKVLEKLNPKLAEKVQGLLKQ